MSSGACYLPRRFNGIEKWFTQQQEAAWWNTPSELFSHIKYYLSRDDERVRVADAGMKAVRADHSWEQRMRSVMRLVNGRTIRTFWHGSNIQEKQNHTIRRCDGFREDGCLWRMWSNE